MPRRPERPKQWRGERFVSTLEVILGIPEGKHPRGQLEQVLVPLRDVAERLDAVYETLHKGTDVEPRGIVEVLAQTREVLRQRNAELLQNDLELAQSISQVECMERELAEVRRELQECRQVAESEGMRLGRSLAEVKAKLRATEEELANERRKPEVKACTSELAQTRRLLQDTRDELEITRRQLQAGFVSVREPASSSPELAELRQVVENTQRELTETCRQLQEVTDAGKQDQAKLQKCEEELAKTRQLLQRSRIEVEQYVSDLNCIRLQLSRPSSAARERGAVKPPEPPKVQDLVPKLHEEEAARLRRELKQLQTLAEKELDDYSAFVRRLAGSSAGPVLSRTLGVSTATVLGMGSYGYVLLCQDKLSKANVVVKLQSQRWIDVAAREWAHATNKGSHPHIVGYRQAFLHRDDDGEIERGLEAAFAAGILTGKRPKRFPDLYVAITMEYMDRGTVKDLIDERAINAECIAAVARQTASALDYLHKQQRTHNDIKPVNVLLQAAKDGHGTLVVKLADFSLAEHSSARTRDFDLLAVTLHCMGLLRDFKRCPSAEERASAVDEFAAACPSGQEELWRVLTRLIDELWKGQLTMWDVAETPELKGCKVVVTPQLEEKLEVSAKETVLLGMEAATQWQSQWRGAHHKVRLGADAVRHLPDAVSVHGQAGEDTPTKLDSGEEDHELELSGSTITPVG